MTELFGPCAYCDEDALVKVNDVAVCIKHMDEAMAQLGGLVRRIREELT